MKVSGPTNPKNRLNRLSFALRRCYNNPQTVNIITEETENLMMPILQDVQQRLIALDHKVDDLHSNMNLQFAALNEKHSGQLISEIELREELRQQHERIMRIERRLELTEQPK